MIFLKDIFCLVAGFILALIILIPLFSDYKFQLGVLTNEPQDITTLPILHKSFDLLNINTISIIQDIHNPNSFVFFDKELQKRIVLDLKITGKGIKEVWKVPNRLPWNTAPTYTITSLSSEPDALYYTNKDTSSSFFEKYKYFMQYMSDILWKEYNRPFIANIDAQDIYVKFPRSKASSNRALRSSISDKLGFNEETTLQLLLEGIHVYPNHVIGTWKLKAYTKIIKFN